MKLIDQIKQACKEKGIPEKFAERIQKTFKIEKEEDIAGFVDIFKDNLLPTIQEAENEARTAAQAAAVTEYEQRHGLKDGKPVDPATPPATPPISGLSPEMKAFMEAQSKQIADLTTLVTNSTKVITNAEKMGSAKQLIVDAKLPAGWIGRLNLDSETPLQDQVKTLVDEYTEIRQGVINDAVATGQYSPGGAQMTDRSEADWAKFMDSNVNASNPGVVDLGI